MAKRMRQAEKFEQILEQFAPCQIVAFADMSTGTVLYSKARTTVRQEKLDALCRTAAETLEGEAANRVVRAVSDVADTGVHQAIIIEPGEIGFFLRPATDATEALCCVCTPEVRLGEFIQYMQETNSVQVAQPPSHQSRKPLSDLKILQDRIVKLSRDTDTWSGNRRNIVNTSVSDPVAGVVREICETSSPRWLIFRNDQDQALSLEVSAGRVCRLMDSTSEEFLATCPDFAHQELGGANEQEIACLTEIISSFSVSSEEITVESRFLESATDTVGTGIPGSRLQEDFASLNSASDRLSDPVKLNSFVEIALPRSTSLLNVNQDTVTLQRGPDDQVELLKSLALAENSANSDAVQRHPDRGVQNNCIVLTGPADQGHGILCAKTLGGSVFLTFEAGNFGKILDLWQSASVQRPPRAASKSQASDFAKCADLRVE